MDGNSRHQVIKRLQAGLPRGAPFDLATLSQFGVSPQLAAHYADGGWLVRLAHGVYAFPNDEFGVYGALKFLQQRVPGLVHRAQTAQDLPGPPLRLARQLSLEHSSDRRYAIRPSV
ncbi:AbiEi antitoxin N-terminal domain-containing protein, partial [Stutzerimonas stutzeri]|uniref:AbiEi antitoxin N-terminal domain-containing protein n=1 Tax=Stutzerimonas stutzeri TaxID=316 RepID=UPI003D076A6D